MAFSLLAGAFIFSATQTAANSDNISSPDFIYLTWASPDPAHTINVSWKTDENYVGKVFYDTESGAGLPESYSNSKTGSGAVSNDRLAGYYHHVELTDLEPDTKYYFIVGSSESGWSEEQSFETPPAEPNDLTFVVGGDSRSNKFFHEPNPHWPEARNEVTEVAASYNPDFISFGGDYLSSGQQQNGSDTWENWLGAWFQHARRDDGSLIPLVPVVGNHEIAYPQPSDYIPLEDAPNYYTVFNLPCNERWYSLDWGPQAHFTVLDSEILDTDTNTWSNQLNWLESDLDANENDVWKFASFHRPLYSTPGEHEGELEHLEDWTTPFDKYHLDVAFQSHNHGYERTGPINHTTNPGELASSTENGTIYVTAAGWGAELYGNAQAYSWFTAEDSPGRLGEPENAFHCVINKISGGTYEYKAVKYNGAVLDSMTIQKEAAGINQTPTAGFTFSPSAPNSGETVDFDASSSSDSDGEIASYEWDFDGDGEIDSTGKNVSYQFPSEGTYNVVLKVTDDDDAVDKYSENVTVNPPQFTISVSVGSGSGSVNLDPSGGTYNEGVSVSVTANPDTGYEFDHWSGDLSGSSKNKTVVVDSEMNITAHFTEAGGGEDGLPLIWIGVGIIVLIGIVAVFVFRG